MVAEPSINKKIKADIKCPDCKSTDIENIGGNRRHCQKCGRVFNLRQLEEAKK